MGSLGHTDRIVVCDEGLPIDKNVKRIDLSITKGVVKFMDVLKPLLDELVVEKIILAQEIVTKSPAMYQEILALAKGIPLELVSHEEFKKLTKILALRIQTLWTLFHLSILPIFPTTLIILEAFQFT
jgi:D-ribose pyranase